MSEYQYYEFQAIDKPLNKKQQEALRDISSRAEISATSFTNEYSFGDFKGNPLKLMEKYFDAFLYYANWGTRILMFKIPQKLLNMDLVSAYCCCESNRVYSKGSNLIFEFTFETDEDDFEEWMLSAMISLRSDLMQGDYRSLYIGWLSGVQNFEFDDEKPEPEIPQGLNNLNGSLQEFAGFLGVDKRLIESAAILNPAVPVGIGKKELLSWIKSLSQTKKDRIIVDYLLSMNPLQKDELINEFKTKMNVKPNKVPESRLVEDIRSIIAD